MLMGHQIKISLMNIVYKKSIILSTSARKTTTLGEMTNLITNDAGQFEFGIYQLVGQVNDKNKCEIFGLNNYYFQKAC